ncbi:MAG: DUF2318 domain-containing protein [Fusobacterium sp.]|nr:DUF2318 domain-containing protein [Fusobacterium sp.]
MLKFYIFVIELLFIFSFLFGINFSILNKEKNYKIKKYSYISIATISFVGFIATAILTFLRRKFPQKMVKYTLFYNRWTLSYAMIFISLSLLVLFLFFIIRKKNAKNLSLIVYEILSFIGIWLLGFSVFPQLYILATEFVAFGETSFGTQSLMRVGGFLLGLITIFMLGLSAYKVNIRLKAKEYKIFSFVILLVAFIDFSLKGVSALARLRILTARNPLVFEMMILEDKSFRYILTLLTIVTIIFSVKLFLNSVKLVGTFKNNAYLRIEKLRLIKNKRWSTSLIVFVLISLFSITTVKNYINKPVELSPPENYTVENNFIIIPLSDVDDGHLHRFSYIAEEGGNDVRFIAVKKPRGGSYGLGLDACDICGVAGYFERNDEVVCKRCDVVMNKATIGFRGGCNPIPFEYEIKDSKIIIDKAVLEKEKTRFPVGD